MGVQLIVLLEGAMPFESCFFFRRENSFLEAEVLLLGSRPDWQFGSDDIGY